MPSAFSRFNRVRTRAFSLVELVMVVITIGLISAIAIPRVSGAAARSRAGALAGDLSALARAIEYYAAEHSDLTPADNRDGSRADGVKFALRLTAATDDAGDSTGTRIFGPYLREIPPNPYNGLATVRVDGDPAGADTHGWRFSTATRSISADHSSGSTGGTVNIVSGKVEDGAAVMATVSGDAKE